MRTYPCLVTKTTEEQLKEHMMKANEIYDTRVQPHLDEQRRILNILAYENPYKKHSWRRGHPERRFKHGYDTNTLTEEGFEERTWVYNIARELGWCIAEYKWEDQWVHDFQYKIQNTRELMRDNDAQIKEQDEMTFQLAKKEWMEQDAVWIAREKLRKNHEHHEPKSYYIDLFAKDKDAERHYDGKIPDNEDTCEFCINDKRLREIQEEARRKADEEYERLREEADQEHRRREEEKKNQKPVKLTLHECKVCEYKTMDSAMFRIHLMSREHLQREKQKNLFCEHCDYQCRGKLEYEAHIRTTKHKKNAGELDGPTTYTCEACEYSTAFRHHYENHVRSRRHMDRTTQEVVVPTTD